MSPRWQLPVLGALALVYLGHAAGFGDWLIDDAGISFGYARRLADGLPLAINAGEPPVEGYSNPSWTALVALCYALGLFSLPLSPKLLGAAFVLASMGLAWWTSRRMFGDEGGAQHLLAPALMAGVATFVQWSVSGLENAIFSFSQLLALAVHVRERRSGRGAWAGLAAFWLLLGRPEGVLYVGALALDKALAGDRRGLGRWALGLGLPFGAYAAWHTWTFPDLLPNTFYAKVSEGRAWAFFSWNDAGWRYLRAAVGHYGLHWAPLLAALAWRAPRRMLDAGALALYGMAAAAAAFPIYAGGDWMPGHRLATPLYPLLGLMAAAGVSVLPRAIGRVLPWAALGLSALWVPSRTLEAWDALGMKLLVQLGTLDGYARWAEAVGERPFTLALGDLGGASMTTDERFILVDLFGLVDREVALRLRATRTEGHEPAWRYLFETRQADALYFPEAVHNRWAFAESEVFARDYWLVQTRDEREPPRAGSWIRRDLVEGRPPPELLLVDVGPAVKAAARLEEGGLRAWWLVGADQKQVPAMRVRWTGARRTETLRAFGGVFGPTLFRKGRSFSSLHPAPVGATGVEILGGAAVEAGAGETAAASAPTAKPAAATDVSSKLPANGDFEGAGEWFPIPQGAGGWALVSDEGQRLLQVELAGGALVCSRWMGLDGRLELRARVKVEGAEGGQGAVMSLRVKRKDESQTFPVLASWTGSRGWEEVEASYEAKEDDTSVRVCFGSARAVAGRLRVDDVRVAGATPTAGG